mmetsp:Transcript_22893/g.39169  ORF Transcript_22893/g.39169 Transcript_22893/m.39169 type:complete len:184 (-) Transcript_22893:370-921(-)|eukprot:CAMPEP_0183733048 /NCGR_PEP_ID=MMETSP0737-20130205/40029_1 /TAXON_ID=385413 /ORGANISM="Thalassiosira miniscula, Strain CCMP1093" /LENGTH=183 /DNA_ID=CAMNT_0025966219 /DNA_START=52 /DNA_END=603 /DNA_ORIENTATION=+
MVTSAVPPILLALSALTVPSSAFQSGGPLNLIRMSHAGPLKAADETLSSPTKPSLDPDVAAQFTIKVCTSTSCTRKLKEQGLDQYHALGEVYAMAQSANMEKCVIIEDGACQGGKNCKMGPCVAIQHEDFVGNVALEGMNSNEFNERVFHNVLTEHDAQRVWSCMENAITLMSEEGENDESEP